MIETASSLLSEIDSVVLDHALSSMKKKVISAKDREKYASAKYIVTTIVPYVDDPEERQYVLNQAELDAFLLSYSETGEFIIRIEKE